MLVDICAFRFCLQNWISANGFTVQYDARKVKKAVLSVEGNAMYLTYAPVAPAGIKLILR